MRKGLYQSKLYTYLEALGTLFLNNIFFMVAILPLVLTYQVIDLEIKNSLFYYLMSISLGPAYLALLISIRTYHQNKGFIGLGFYLRHYKESFFKGLSIELTYGLFQYILLVDYLYLYDVKIFRFLFVILFLIAGLLKINAYLINVRYDITFKNLFKASFVLSTLHPFISVQNLLFYTIPLILLFYIPQFVVFISVSLFALLITRNTKRLYKTLDEIDQKTYAMD